jgi:glycosyltransferase 2 family protein
MRATSRKFGLVLLALLVFGLLIYRSSGMLHLGDFSGTKLLAAVRGTRESYLLLSILTIYACYAVRALRWREFQKHVGRARFWNIYAMTLAGFSSIFLLGRAGEPVRPLLLSRKGRLPIADTFGIYVLERLLDTASTAVLAAIGLLLFSAHAHQGATADALETAAKTTGSFLFAGVAAAIVALVYLRLHGTALLERRLQSWLASHGWRPHFARIVLGLIRGIQTIRSWGELAAAVIYSALHWFLVLLVFYLVTQSFGGKLAALGFSDVILVLAFTLVGSAVQLPGMGGGSQVACFLAYTTIFGVEKEPAAAAAIVMWLITFAACSFAGVPLLIHEGFTLGKLREMAEREKEVIAEEAAGGVHTAVQQGESAE